MSKKVDAELLDARLQDIGTRVREGQFIEKLKSDGRSVESLEEKAKEILGLDESDSLLANGSECLKVITSTNSILYKLNSVNTGLSTSPFLSEEDKSLLLEIESKLANKVASTFDLSIDELYGEA